MITAKEIEFAIRNMWLCVDTREHQDADGFKERVIELYELCGGEECNRPERMKLDYGDYTAKTQLPDGTIIDLSSVARIERKVGWQELIGNLLTEKERFEREFTKAKDARVKMHLVVEEGSYTKLFNGKYENHPKANPRSVIGSFFALIVRYDVSVHFCKKAQCPQVIYNILKSELENYLNPKDGHRFDTK